MTLRLNGSTSGYTEIDAPAVAGSNTLVLPAGNGTNGQVLTTNGSGALSWGDGSAPAGTILWFAANTAPTGYLKANGATISRTTYSALFAAIGTTFGVGDGSTTFAIPDLRGEFLRGWDDSRGVDTSRTFGSAQSDELKSHNHTVTDLYNGGGGGAGGGGANTGTVSTTQTTSSTGGTETRPRNIALLACIKF